MIVGDGMLARAFAGSRASESWTIFASGVSNSRETARLAFDREEQLLLRCLTRAAPLVYFSSCGLIEGDTSNSPYMEHKRHMESVVLAKPGARVFRLPQVVGHTSNPHTLLNFLRGRILAGEPFDVWRDAERNLIDIDDVVKVATRILQDDAIPERVVSIAAEQSVPMPGIVACLEQVLGKKALAEVRPLGAPMPVDTAICRRVAMEMGLDLGAGYLEKVLRKYCLPMQSMMASGLDARGFHT
jgi:nucleoside-diphosphate-sugar epimerase